VQSVSPDGHRLLRGGGAHVLDLPDAELAAIASDVAEIASLPIANQTAVYRFTGTAILSLGAADRSKSPLPSRRSRERARA
jgi:hypothetical protein